MSGTGLSAERSFFRRRHLLFPVVVMIHVLLLMLLILAPEAQRMGPADVPLSLFDVAGEETVAVAPAPEPVEIVRPEPVVQLDIPTNAPPAEPVFDQAAAQQAGFGTTCDITETLTRAFEGNAQIRSALAAIWPQDRSVANAIMLWDDEWVQLSGGGDFDTVALLRRGIVEGVKAAPAECLEQEISGPRFISISEGAQTTVLVLGSGAWRWGELTLPEEGEEGGTTPASARGQKDSRRQDG